ncbi:MAG: hypothetical protein WBH86_07190 [Thermogutta sp.]|nr:hypothetical protein [Thermogutta sp.]
MSTTIHTIRLRSSAHFGGKVPPGPLGTVLQVLPAAVRRTVLMAVQGRSIARGTSPTWLSAASDVRLVDYASKDDTILKLESPRLGDVAPELYEQKQFWPTLPAPQDTGIDLLADVLADLAAGNLDSERFDQPLLRQLTRFEGALEHGFEAIEVLPQRRPTGQPSRLDRSVLEIAERFCAATPPPERVRLAGTLDMVRASTRTFGIRLEQGEELRGVLLEEDIHKIAPLLGKQVLVLGRVQYKPSGRALRIDAEEVKPAHGDVSLWSRIPPARGQPINASTLRRPQGPRSGLAAVIGRWPGDESDHEIEAWLEEIS